MIRFGVIGTNFITDRFLKAGEFCKDFQLIAVYSRTIDRAKKYATHHDAKYVFDNLEELARCDEVDAVYVASPNYCHAQHSILMMNHGKHILCEKPVASNEQELEKMLAAAEKNQVVFLEAVRQIYMPGFQAIKENLEKIGKIRRVTFSYCKYSSRYDNFKRGIIENAFRPELSNGALMDIGVYGVHMLGAIFGMPKQMQSACIKLSNGVDAEGTILAEYDGMLAEVMYSKVSSLNLPAQIQGEEGTMLIEQLTDPVKIRMIFRDGSETVTEIPEEEPAMVYEIRTFTELIKNEAVRHVYLENSRTEMRITDEVRRQQGIVFPADEMQKPEKEGKRDGR